MNATLPKHVKLDERNHVERPLLDQLAGLCWEVIDLADMKQALPTHTSGELHRGRDAAGVARTAQGHQPLARRRSDRGGRQAVRQQVTRHAIA